MGQDRIAVSSRVFWREANRRIGLDSKYWFAEESVDKLILRSELPRPDSMGLAWENKEAVGHSVDLMEGTNCQQALHVMARLVFPETIRRMAGSSYFLGVKNLFFGISRATQACQLQCGLERIATTRTRGRNRAAEFIGEAEPCLGDGFVAQGW